MPEIYIVYRKLFRDQGYTATWWAEFSSLSDSDRDVAKLFMYRNAFSETALTKANLNSTVRSFLRHYTVPRTVVDRRDEHHSETKRHFDQLILDNQFIDLTLTYDFDMPKRQIVGSKGNIALGRKRSR